MSSFRDQVQAAMLPIGARAMITGAAKPSRANPTSSTAVACDEIEPADRGCIIVTVPSSAKSKSLDEHAFRASRSRIVPVRERHDKTRARQVNTAAALADVTGIQQNDPASWDQLLPSCEASSVCPLVTREELVNLQMSRQFSRGVRDDRSEERRVGKECRL